MYTHKGACICVYTCTCVCVFMGKGVESVVCGSEGRDGMIVKMVWFEHVRWMWGGLGWIDGEKRKVVRECWREKGWEL